MSPHPLLVSRVDWAVETTNLSATIGTFNPLTASRLLPAASIGKYSSTEASYFCGSETENGHFSGRPLLSVKRSADVRSIGDKPILAVVFACVYFGGRLGNTHT